MTRVRIALIAGVACLALGGTMISTAVAAQGGGNSAGATSVAPLFKHHVTGFSKSGSFSGTYAVQRFVVARVHGKRGVYAIGTLTGQLQGHRIVRNNVMMPASLQGSSSAKTATRSPRAASCTILHLVLAPITLNLLGLHVTIAGGTLANPQPIVIDLTAVQGQGLLGDLLCGLDNALNGTGILARLSNQLSALAGTLNSLGSLVGAGAATAGL